MIKGYKATVIYSECHGLIYLLPLSEFFSVFGWGNSIIRANAQTDVEIYGTVQLLNPLINYCYIKLIAYLS